MPSLEFVRAPYLWGSARGTLKDTPDKQDKHFACNVRLWRVRVTIVVV